MHTTGIETSRVEKRLLKVVAMEIVLGLLTPIYVVAQQPLNPNDGNAPSAVMSSSGTTPVQSNSSFVDGHGTTHVVRNVPVPKTVSKEAQVMLARQVADTDRPESLAARRRVSDEEQNQAGKAFRKLYRVDISNAIMADVPVRVVMPTITAPDKADRVLINLHGGGFNSDSGSMSEAVPIAALTKTRTIAVMYRLAPEHPFPAALNDAIAVYRAVLKTTRPQNVVIFGTSAGAILTAEVAVRLKQLGLPLPGALGIFSGMGDFSRYGDSQEMYGLGGLSGPLDLPPNRNDWRAEYRGDMDPRDPTLSPIFADLHGMPPTLFITSGRDLFLSGTTILHRAFLTAGDDAELVVFEGLPHAFWYDSALPETQEAVETMAQFFDRVLGTNQSKATCLSRCRQ